MNPYQVPESKIVDNYNEPPIVKQATYLLLGLWFITLAMPLPFIFSDIEWSIFELWELGLVIALLLAVLIAPYFFLLYWPVKKLKRTAWRWWLITAWIFLGISLWSDMTDDSLLDPPSLENWLLFVSSYLEVVVLFIGAYWLRRPASLVQLTQ